MQNVTRPHPNFIEIDGMFINPLQTANLMPIPTGGYDSIYQIDAPGPYVLRQTLGLGHGDHTTTFMHGNKHYPNRDQASQSLKQQLKDQQ